jgi:hypothetical protein
MPSVQLYAFAWIYNSAPAAVFPGAVVRGAPWFLAVITTSADLFLITVVITTQIRNK